MTGGSSNVCTGGGLGNTHSNEKAPIDTSYSFRACSNWLGWNPALRT